MIKTNILVIQTIESIAGQIIRSEGLMYTAPMGNKKRGYHSCKDENIKEMYVFDMYSLTDVVVWKESDTFPHDLFMIDAFSQNFKKYLIGY